MFAGRFVCCFVKRAAAGHTQLGYRLFTELRDLKSRDTLVRTDVLLELASIPCYDDARGKFAASLPHRQLGGWWDRVYFFFRTYAQAAMIWQLNLDA